MIPIRQHNLEGQKSEKINFAKMVRGIDIIEDAVLELDKFKKSKYKNTFADKDAIVRALENEDVRFLREMSNYYFSLSGMYSRFVQYLAGILTYDWLIYPYMLKDKYDSKKVKKDLSAAIEYVDNILVKSTFYEISLKVIIDGAFYGYMINNEPKTRGTILELPVDYCRSRYKYNGTRAVEFNVKYFDEQIKDAAQREIILSNFPKEFNKNYQAYKNGILTIDKMDGGAWFLCDPQFAMKFCFYDNDIPVFASVAPSLLDLEQAKQLDQKKTMQELLKIIVQKMPLDKNNEMVFDIDEAMDMHNNACRMLGNAVNVDVLTTFADVEILDLDSSTSATATRDSLSKVERGVFNEAGVSQMLFATDGNIALEKSILNDEALMFYLLNQYQNKLNQIIDFLFNKGKVVLKLSFPELSIYNAERKTKVYKEMAASGYSKILPAIASGVSQSEFLSLIDYENDILNLSDKMVPTQLSSTQSKKEPAAKVGAPTKDEGELAEKTIQNRESQS